MIGGEGGSSLTVTFPGTYPAFRRDYRLLEVSDSRLLAAIESKDPLFIRGITGEEDAVICTRDATFRLSELLTSNLCLVAEETQANEATIVSTPSGTLTASYLARPPGIEQLIKALMSCPFNGADTTQPESFLHVKEIFRSVQASDAEILNFLMSFDAFIVNNHYRILGPSILCRFFEYFFTTAILEDWNMDHLAIDEICFHFSTAHPDEFADNVVRHILTCYSIDEKGSRSFNFVKASRFFAEQLFRAKASWGLSEFVDAWNKTLHDFALPNLESIPDFHVKETHQGSGRVELKRFFRSDLPADVELRFIKLFKERPRWAYEELIPFISDLGSDTKELDAIVLKHGRISTSKSTRFITPRSQLLD